MGKKGGKGPPPALTPPLTAEMLQSIAMLTDYVEPTSALRADGEAHDRMVGIAQALAAHDFDVELLHEVRASRGRSFLSVAAPCEAEHSRHRDCLGLARARVRA